MSTEQNKAIVRRFFEEVGNQGNVAAAGEIFAADVVDHTAPPGQAPGLEGVKHNLAIFRTAFPDVHLTIEDMLAEGDRVVARYTAHATHTGEFFGIPATGKQVVVTGISLSRIAGGKIVEQWGNQDDLGMLQQLGVVPPPGQAS
jgi:steroid delta-isomerase-like uncharacterized protein